jgi:hypothetical protein
MQQNPEYNVVNAWLSLINRCLESFLTLFFSVSFKLHRAANYGKLTLSATR